MEKRSRPGRIEPHGFEFEFVHVTVTISDRDASTLAIPFFVPTTSLQGNVPKELVKNQRVVMRTANNRFVLATHRAQL